MAEDPVIGEKELSRAIETLEEYKQGKANLESRIVSEELWWQLRHWEDVQRGHDRAPIDRGPEPTSAWLFNAIINKHADAMDNMPQPAVLPRERSDESSAKTLSEVLPTLLEYNGFERTYSDAWWYKLKHGVSAYGVFWSQDKENGLGDVEVREVDILKMFWEPGITDLRKSRNLFIVDLVDKDILEQQYPQHKGKLDGSTINVKEYIYDDAVDNSRKSLVVDWYYKRRTEDGRTLLHYCKFVGETVLYATENDPYLRDRGIYDHGEYPVVLDVLWPEAGTPIGYGYVAVCKDPQLYIDKLGGNILENSIMATKRRYFASNTAAINEEEFKDWTRPIVHVEGEISDARLREITTDTLSPIYVQVMQQKIEEMKDTAANRDVNSGGGSSGVTAAAAIAALQEAGNKASRDMISASYRCYTDVCRLIIELIRQFYTEERSFRITGTTPGQPYDFVQLSNAGLQDQPIGMGAGGEQLFRKPIFDLKLKAQRKNPFSRMEQNELAKELYGLGFFNPERAQEAMGALDLMEFEGIEKVREQVQQGQTLLNICQQMSQQMDTMAAMLQQLTGVNMTGGGPAAAPAAVPDGGTGGGSTAGRTMDAIQQSRMPQGNYATEYANRLANAAKPSTENPGKGAMPK